MTQQSIRTITKKKWVVYYPELAYFSPHFKKLSSIEQNDIFLHEQKNKLLLLTLYFDLILLPPEHFVRTVFGAKLFNNSSVRPLFDNGIIVTTYWDQFRDEKTFLDGLKEYLVSIGQSHVISIESSRHLSFIKFFLRDVTGQSNWLRNELLNFLQINKEKIINNYPPKVFEQLLTIVKKSNYKDIIPFSHEKFLMLLNQEENIPYGLKEQIWNKSCSLYYDAGAVGNYCIRYPVFEIDKNNLQYLIHGGIYSVFFHPEFLKVFLISCGLTNNEAIKLSLISGIDILYLRNESKEAWNDFRNLYFDLAKSISGRINELEKKHGISIRSYPNPDVLKNIKNIFRDKLIYNSTYKTNMIAHIGNIILEIISAITQIPLLPDTVKHLKIYEMIESVVFSYKYGTVKYFIDLLRKRLQEVKEK